MTRDQINSYIRHVPVCIRQRTGINELLDLSKERSKKIIHDGKAYLYYPDIPGILIGERLVMWEQGMPDLMDVDIYDKNHFAEIFQRGMSLTSNDIIGLASLDSDGRLKVSLVRSDRRNPSYQSSIPMDGTLIYYRPENVDLVKDAPHRMEARALFLAKRYNRVFIIPYLNRKPKDWGCYD